MLRWKILEVIQKTVCRIVFEVLSSFSRLIVETPVVHMVACWNKFVGDAESDQFWLLYVLCMTYSKSI